MHNSSENQTDIADFSRKNGEEIPAGWNTPKPASIPSPTYWPFILSLGATLMGLGVLTSNIITATGTVLSILAIIKWIGELSSENR